MRVSQIFEFTCTNDSPIGTLVYVSPPEEDFSFTTVIPSREWKQPQPPIPLNDKMMPAGSYI